MITLLVLGIVEAVFVILLIATQRNKIDFSQRIILAWLVAITALLAFNLMSFTSYHAPFVLMVMFDCAPFLFGALIFIFTQSILYPNNKKSYLILHFVSYTIVVVTLFYNQYFTANEILINDGWLIFTTWNPLIIQFFQIAYEIINPLYVIIALIFIKKQVPTLSEFYSDIDKVRVFWLRYFLVGVLIGFISVSLVTPDLLGAMPLSDIEIAGFKGLVYVILIFHTGYVNYRYQADLSTYAISSINRMEQLPRDPKTARYKKAGLASEKALELVNHLQEYMEVNKPYLNPRLTLRDMAVDLGISTNHLSQVINEKLKKNFFSFINEYRVNEFKSRISRGYQDNFTLTGIALDCGFSSKSSFYTVFKKISGMTPTDYIKKSEPTAVVSVD